MPERIDADVCVVGAGYAGLTTARRLRAAGRSVVVSTSKTWVAGGAGSIAQRTAAEILERV